jgi:hypothetical protein
MGFLRVELIGATDIRAADRGGVCIRQCLPLYHTSCVLPS